MGGSNAGVSAALVAFGLGAAEGSRRGRTCRFAAKKRGGRNKRRPQEAKEDIEFIVLPQGGMTVAALGEAIQQHPANIITHFFAKSGLALTMNEVLDRSLCEEICEKYNIETLDEDAEESKASQRGILDEKYDDAKPRPPVVTVMGHVDHGKTTLLDTIRKRAVAAGEAGGITQRIGAYTVEMEEGKITFIDTPGHEAFTSMRARGAQVTDLAVLVVAADDGVMPQTKEAIYHARAADVPIVVAINKIDAPLANAEKTRQSLSEEGLLCEEWGGDVPMVEVSAKHNTNLDSLLEIISLTSQVSELKARYDGPAAGVVLEATRDAQRGSLATLLVQRGTLCVGDTVLAGCHLCKVRQMEDEGFKVLQRVEPSYAVQVAGWDNPPEAGDQFEVFADPKKAMELAQKREVEMQKKAAPSGFATSSDVSGQALKLTLILKTDAQGSIAAVKHMFASVRDSKYVNMRWLLATPGSITDSDVELAKACPKDQRVMIVGFGSTVLPSAARAAKMAGVEIRTFDVIYELFETIVAVLENSLSPEEKLTERGRADVLAVFGGRDGNVAGCRVAQGQLKMGNKVVVFRKDEVVGEGPIMTLREGKEAVTEVDEENECGFGIEGWDKWQKGDKVICYEVAMVRPQIVAEKNAGKKGKK